MTWVKFNGLDAIVDACKRGRVYDSNLEDLILPECIISLG